MQICLCFFSGWGQPDGDSQLANSDLELVDEQILCFGVGGLSLWLCSFLLSLCLRFASLLLFGLRLLSLGFLCSLPFVCSLSLPVAWSLCLLVAAANSRWLCGTTGACFPKHLFRIAGGISDTGSLGFKSKDALDIKMVCLKATTVQIYTSSISSLFP